MFGKEDEWKKPDAKHQYERRKGEEKAFL